MDRTRGYVADIGYTAGFYRETTPAHLAFAALSIGRSPGRALAPQRVLELGCGQGFGLALTAAANPDVAFEGYDLNPDHVAHARRLIDGAALANVTVTEVGFEDAAARGGESDADVIALHGVFSWIARPAQEAVVAILRQRLLPEGTAYVSYNCMPGWAPLVPIRQLMIEVKRRDAGGSERQLALALELIKHLRGGEAAYFTANPAAAFHFDRMLSSDRNYLAHEYLDEHWAPLTFAQAVERLGAAGLAYVASATLTENLPQHAVPRPLQALVAQTGDPVLRETISDFAADKRFRRDIFARGPASVSAAEHRRLLSGLAFAPAAPRERFSFAFDGPLHRFTGQDVLYAPIADLLARQHAGFDALLALPPFGEANTGALLDCLALLIDSGQVLPLARPPADPGPARRFNRMIAAAARAGLSYSHLATPVARGGIRVDAFGLLVLAALHDGIAAEAGAVARHAMAGLGKLGRRPVKEGQPLEDEGKATDFVAETVAPILRDVVPIWRRLGALE